MTPDRIARDGTVVPALGYGTSRLRGEPCRRHVAAALSIGYRLIDTARSYGNEHEIGRAIHEAAVPRDRVFLVTKLHLEDLAPARVLPATASSLRALRTDYIDLLLIHWPSPDVSVAETLDAFMAARARGMVRSIGVSNFTIAWLERARGYPIITDQIEYHPHLQQPELLRCMRASGMLVMASRPTARGGLRDDPTIARLAADRGRAAHQVVLRWHLEQPDVIPITGASSPHHMEENLAALELSLSSDELDAISRLDRGRRTLTRPYAPLWDDYQP